MGIGVDEINAAIEALRKDVPRKTCYDCLSLEACRAKFLIAFAEQCFCFKDKTKYVEQKQGRNLKEDTPSLFECSICHWSCFDTYCGDTDVYNYCPNCGAKMDGD